MSAPSPRHRRRGDAASQRVPLLDRSTAGGPRDWESFIGLLADALETARRTRRPLSVCLVVTEHPMTAVAVARRTVRGTDGAWRIGPDRVGVILVDAGGPGSEAAFVRLSAALADGLGVAAQMGRASAAAGIDAASLLDLAERGLAPIGPRR